VMLAEADDHGQTNTCQQEQGLQVHLHTEQSLIQLALSKGPNWVGRKQIQFPKRRVF
jgi:hypothetical protein